MIGLAFILEDSNKNIYSGTDDSFELWRTTAKSLGCSYFCMIDDTKNKIGKNFKNIDEEIIYEYFESLEAFFAKHHGINSIIGLETQDVCESLALNYSTLQNFSHPEDNVVYIAGTDSQGFVQNHVEISHWVTIPNIKYSFWSIIASSIVLHDRLRK